MSHWRAQSAPRRGFTLVELLVVIGIIGVLVGLVFAVGRAVVGESRRDVTVDVLRVLDTAMQAWQEERDLTSDRNQLPIYWVRNPGNLPTNDPGARRVFPIIDGRAGNTNTDPIIDSTALFLVEARKSARVREILDRIPARFYKRIDVDGTGTVWPELDTVVDSWGNPIRLVLPAVDGIVGDRSGGPLNVQAVPVAQAFRVQLANLNPTWQFAFADVRRAHQFAAAAAQPDSDGGTCVGTRPYFYSMGDDGRVGFVPGAAPSDPVTDFNADNLYSQAPRLPKPL